ncbi:MAG: NAD-dependent epimerase/dehydratase family protein [Nitrospiraceae bacterium]|nr:MAG: NAD-dependent epimerase/dehydratase family protein [Nitrospiraceae bacterium]
MKKASSKKNFSGKTVLVTGCAGFIGWKVSQQLLEMNKKVIGVDNINNYYDPALKTWRLSTLKKHPNFSFYKIDIGDLIKTKAVFKGNRVDAIINLAARAGVRASVEDPWVYLDTNTKGTLNLLECCKDHKVKKFVLASTSSLYASLDMPYKETAKTDTPLAPYSATKKGAEALSYAYHYLYGLDITVLRYFTVYGPAGRPDMSIFKFVKNMDAGKPIPVFGDGNQTRDFTYIDDIADGTIRALRPMGYEIINLGSDHPVKLNYVIGLLEKHLGKKAKRKVLKRHPADVTATWAHIEKAKKMLGWKPKMSLEQGVENTVNWFLENKTFLKSLKWKD